MGQEKKNLGSELKLKAFAMVLDKDGNPIRKLEMDMVGGNKEVPITDEDREMIRKKQDENR